MFDINCIGFPAFGENGELIPPYNLRMPTRINHDLTLFKNFAIHGEQKMQFRIGFFNMFNQAFATTAVARGSSTWRWRRTATARSNGVPNGVGGTADNVCDPTGGFSFTQNPIENFGKINILRGRRVIEFALKYCF